jgi:OOP family OmpA-OmpF porin
MIKKTVLCFMLVSGLIGLSINARCETLAGSFFLSPMVGGHVFEGNQDPYGYDVSLDHALTYGLGIGFQITEHLGTELILNMTPTQTDPGNTDVDVFPARWEFFVNLTPKSVFVPYIAAGVGSITYSLKDMDNESDFMVDYGVGFKYFMTDAVALRGDVRHLISFNETHNSLLYSLGLVFSFGGHKAEPVVAAKKEEPPVEIAPVIVEKDSDGDGVVDSKDKCPDTLPGTAVDKDGCPLDSDHDGVTDDKDKCPGTEPGVAVDESGCPVVKDSDGDGVPDASDACPDTPKGTPVDEKGCPLDSDHDGITDNLDKCPGTPAGATVDERGCWVVKNLRFATAKTKILPASLKHVDDVVNVMRKNPDLKLEIQGYTDNKGSAKSNMALSDKRAKAVMAYIVSKGIAKDRLSAKGYGIENPAASNDTEEGRALNRRVELKPVQ